MTDIQKLKHSEFYYLDYINNFLSTSYFAEYYGWTIKHASEVIKRGKKANRILTNLNNNT